MAAAVVTRNTPEDLLEITDRPMPELIDGQLVEREPMGQISDAVAATVLFLIKLHVRNSGLGLVNGAQGSYQIFPDDPEKVRIPDVSFTSVARLPKGLGEARHGKVPPDLVVEVLSPNDKAVDVGIKVSDFLAAGVRIIWVVNPFSQDVQTYHQDGSTSRLTAADVLRGGDVLPGFECPVATLFER